VVTRATTYTPRDRGETVVAVPAVPQGMARSPFGANRNLRVIAGPMVFFTVGGECHANKSLPIQEKNHVETRGKGYRNVRPNQA
jgi:hypothetical protein